MACDIWKGGCLVGLSFFSVREVEGEMDDDYLADSNLIVVLRKSNATAMSMETARKWLETRSVYSNPYSVR